MKKIALYPGTFDPLTNGHLDIVERAAPLFDELIIAVAASNRKSPRFELSDRLQICTEACAHLTNIKVKSFNTLTVDFAQQHGAQYILRGIRAVSDFDYEHQIAAMNQTMAPNIETVFLAASSKVAGISGTMVREIASLGGDVAPFVPSCVLKYFG